MAEAYALIESTRTKPRMLQPRIISSDWKRHGGSARFDDIQLPETSNPVEKCENTFKKIFLKYLNSHIARYASVGKRY